MAEAYIRDLACQACHLLECDAASLFLGYPEIELRHPLLVIPPDHPYQYAGGYGLPGSESILQNEHIQALCDLAMQTGEVQLSKDACWVGDIPYASFAIAPLERPAGMLGFLLLLGAEAFAGGERSLLSQYAPTVALDIETELRTIYIHFLQTHAQEVGTPELEASLPAAPPEAMLSPREELERLKNEFISIISHELRSPLTAIKGYASLLQAYGFSGQVNESSPGEMTTARQQQYLSIIMEQADHLEVLIHDMLDMSRIHAGRLTLRRTSVDLIQLCQRAVQLIQYRVSQQPSKCCTIRCMFAPRVPFVLVDPDRVQQVLTNLLDNAVKYSPDGGLVEVVVSTDPREPSLLALTVRDYGIGIAPEQQAHLFQPFTRAENAVASQVPGIGLGLYITRKLVEAMGGSVTLSSREGEGTSVTCTFPISLPATFPFSAEKSNNTSAYPLDVNLASV